MVAVMPALMLLTISANSAGSLADAAARAAKIAEAELSGETVRIYENRAPNFKITTVEDLQIASALLVK